MHRFVPSLFFLYIVSVLLLQLLVSIIPRTHSYSTTTTTPRRTSITRMMMSDDTASQPQNVNQKKKKRMILLDRDGVINEDVGAPGVVNVSQLQLTPNAGNAIAKLKELNDNDDDVIVVMITNQSCVGKGIITENELAVIQDKVQQLLLDEHPNAILNKIYQCTSTKTANDFRMKPAPGMILEALRDFNVGDVSTTNHCCCCCCFVGDTLTDLQAAAAAGVPTRILVATGYGEGLMNGIKIPPKTTSDSGGSDSGVIHCRQPGDAPDNFPKSIFPFVYCRNLEHAVEYILSMDGCVDG